MCIIDRGYSYGGYLTLAAIAFFPERRWAAAIDIFGVSNYATQFEQSPRWRRPLREVEFGSLDRDREFLESIAPAKRADAIRAPLMIIHGANDSLVPISQSEEIAAPLRARHHDLTFVRYEDEGHGIAHAHNIADMVTRIVEFFGRHMQ
jgi:dipeptidyl aminopeptidase/acylaminoacyl peptidase